MVGDDFQGGLGRHSPLARLLEAVHVEAALVDGRGSALAAGLLHSYISPLGAPVDLLVPGTEEDVVELLSPAQSAELGQWIHENLDEIMSHHADLLFDEVVTGATGEDAALDEGGSVRDFLIETAEFLATGPLLFRAKVPRTDLGRYVAVY